MVAKHYPDYFMRAVEAEERIGFKQFNDISLRDLAELDDGQLELDLVDTRPCMCAF